MKIIFLLLSAIFCISFSQSPKKSIDNQKNRRIERNINTQWTFNYFPEETAGKGYELPGYDDSKWPAISLPHTWNTYETTGEFLNFPGNAEGSDNPYWWMGWGWYRKHFLINSDYADRKVFIEFEGVQKYCKIWLNGKYLGDHKSPDSSFDFDITGYVEPGKDNVLAVAVNNRKTESGKPLAKEESSDVYGGLCSNVRIVFKDNLYIPMQGSSIHEGGTSIITQPCSGKEGIVNVLTWVKNDNLQKKNCTLQTTILDAEDNLVQVIKSEASINPGQFYKFDQTSKSIKDPHMWSAENPYMYKVYSCVIDGKEAVDAYTSCRGFRFTREGDTTMVLKSPGVLNIVDDVFLKNMSRDSVIAQQGIASGRPAKITLNGSQQKIVADRGSVSIITADVVDSSGNHVYGANTNIKWKISGPAKLIGPAVYESDITRHHQTDGIWYLEMPVSNVIRSTGKPGRIHVSVSASGLASGSFDIIAEGYKPDNSVILEPVLDDEGRAPVVRLALKSNRLDEIPIEIMMTSENFRLKPSDKSEYSRIIGEYILKNNRSVDPVSVEFKTLVDLFASQLVNNNGRLIADDYNFNADNYNTCRLISGYINSTKLPLPFKEGLKKYYANAIILQGSEKDTGEEMNWLNWIPSGGTVVFVQNGNAVNNIKGVIYTKNKDLAGIISLVYPGFVKFSREAKERALIFISKMNPFVHVTSTSEQNRESDKNIISNVSFTAEEGQPILIPLLKFIAE
jgi:hypothetical protein